jgi:16S rRNA (adenine1518-N6/adenine1519-N6)-dimethyltransferase
MEYQLKKSLGQHFLHDQQICKSIVALVDVNMPNWMEVGPGGGAITKYLLELPLQQFSCVEIDAEKVEYLLKNYPQLQGKIIHQDFLQTTLPPYAVFNVIGNFPYNISTQIIFKLLDWRQQVHTIIGMFQKEVAVRFASKHGSKNYGITSVITQAFFDIEYMLDVPPSAFTPPPKVDSGVIRLINNNNPHHIQDYKQFKIFIKAAFSQRRKTLRNALKSIITPDKLQDDIFGKRAEQISVAQFAELFHHFYPNPTV